MHGVRRKGTELLAAGLLAACTPVPPYESTAAKLTRMERAAPDIRFVKEWQPVRAPADDPRPHDNSNKFWLDSCVSELTARFTPAPADVVRALQIAECMQARGWRLAVRESSTIGESK